MGQVRGRRLQERTRAGLAVGKDAHIVAVNGAADQILCALEHLHRMQPRPSKYRQSTAGKPRGARMFFVVAAGAELGMLPPRPTYQSAHRATVVNKCTFQNE